MFADMHMPGVDGFALIEQLRDNKELPSPTIAMLISGSKSEMWFVAGS